MARCDIACTLYLNTGCGSRAQGTLSPTEPALPAEDPAVDHAGVEETPEEVTGDSQNTYAE